MEITQAELEMLEACQTGDEWDDTCTVIKRAHGGNYPSDWWAKVKLSGLMDRVLARFGETSDLKITPFRLK